MKQLYHGTRYLKKILADESLRLPAFGEDHVSLTTKKYVAKYWAEMERDNVFGFGYVFHSLQEQQTVTISRIGSNACLEVSTEEQMTLGLLIHSNSIVPDA